MENENKKQTNLTYKFNRNESIWDSMGDLIAVDVDDDTVDLVLNEFLHKIDCIKNNKEYKVDINKNAYLYKNNKELMEYFNNRDLDGNLILNYTNILKMFRMDIMNCNRLRKQLGIMQEYVKNEYNEIIEYTKRLNKFEIRPESEEVESVSINKEESEIVENKVKLDRSTHKKYDLSGREANCILGIIKVKKEKIKLLEEIEGGIVKTIEKGERFREFLEITEKKSEI